MIPTPPSLTRLARAASATESRLRAAEALRWCSLGMVPTLVAAVAFVTYVKLTHGAHGVGFWVLAIFVLVLLLATLGAAVYAFVRRRPHLFGAVRLDTSHGLSDRVSTALAFARMPEGEQTPLMRAAIEDAIEHGAALSPSRAAPVRPTRDTAVAAGLALGLACLLTLQWSRQTLVARAPTINAVELAPDDVALFQDAVAELRKQEPSPEVMAALERFNTLVEDIAKRRIDRDEAFRRMGDLERALRESQEASSKAFDDALKQRADALKKSALAKPAGEALAKKDFVGAEKAMKDLAQRLRDPKAKISEDEKKRLKDALAAASSKQKEAIAKLEARREELRASLLQREQKAAQNDEERRLLQRDKRELDRLDRDLAEKERAQRELDRLDRELAKAAEDLMRDLGLSADDLEKSAEDINRMAREELNEQEKEELRQRLQEMRELLRQEGQGGEQLRKRLRKFAKRARGEQGGGQGDKGDKQPGEGGDDDDDENGQGQKQGQKNGQGQGDGEWVIGPGGKKMFVLRTSRSQGQGQQGQGQGQGQQGEGQGQQGPGAQPGGQGQGPGGESWGTGHDPNLGGKATSGKFGTHDVQEGAADTGQGPSVSETIQGAAERGFASRGYKRVFTDYRTKAEEAMKNEDIPSGYRFYVQRYFQLIRPREDAGAREQEPQKAAPAPAVP